MFSESVNSHSVNHGAWNTLWCLFFLHVSKGELKTPSISIPKGTIVAVFYTFTVYVLLFILVSATCERSETLHNSDTKREIHIPHMTEILFLQDTVGSGLWVPPKNKHLASIRHHRDILRLSVSRDVLYDRRIPHPPRSCLGPPLRWDFHSLCQSLLCARSCSLRGFCFAHRFAIGPGCHHNELGESVGGSAVHLGSGTG